MRAAVEVFLCDAVNGTSLGAFAAAGTFFVVNNCKIVLNVDRSVGAGLFALAASNTTVFTSLSGDCSLVVIGAENRNARSVLDKRDNLVWAGANTDSATDTALRIYPCNTVFNSDSVLRAGSNTVAVAETSEGAKLITVIAHIGYMTALFAVIVKFSFCNVTVSVAGNVGDLLNYVLGFNTKNLGNLLCRSVTTRNAGVRNVTFARGERLGVAVTAAIAAGSAVGAGETIADRQILFVFLDRKKV